jgi:hypothetical protein
LNPPDLLLGAVLTLLLGVTRKSHELERKGSGEGSASISCEAKYLAIFRRKIYPELRTELGDKIGWFL